MQSNTSSGFLQPPSPSASQQFLTPESGLSLTLSDFGTAEGDESVYYTVNNSDYSTTLEDILSEDGEGEGNREREVDRDTIRDFEEDEDEDEAFVYTGVDAEDPGDYRSQLKDVLGDEAGSVEGSEAEVERSYSLSVPTEDDDDSYEFSYEEESRKVFITANNYSF